MSESTSYDNLIAGTQKALVTEAATVRMGEAFSRGALVGRLTSTQKWQTLDFGQIANFDKLGIATEAIDSTAGEVVTDIFVEGEFSENGVIFAYSDTPAEWRALLDVKGIYLRKTVSVLGQ
jgi:hypothetical protein